MRNVLFCFILLGIGYLYFEKSGVSVSQDDQFRMPALEAPTHVGTLIEERRDDLFVPHSGKFEYSVPEHTAREATIHWIGERRWYSYHPDTKHGPSPVIMLFHGAGRNGLSMIDMWRDTADQHGLFLIAGMAKIKIGLLKRSLRQYYTTSFRRRERFHLLTGNTSSCSAIQTVRDMCRTC